MKVFGLTCDFKRNPVGIGGDCPLLQWKIMDEAFGTAQRAYRVCAASDASKIDAPDLWDSGIVASSETRCVYSGKKLASNAKVHWRVCVWSSNRDDAVWSDVANWRQGIAAEDWRGEWIGNDRGRELYNPNSPYYCADDFDKGNSDAFLPQPCLLRDEFEADADISTATLYVSAYGLAEVYINGEKATAGHLVPGVCDYNKRVYYFAYDVSKRVVPGRNAIAAVLADGWYAGYIGLNPREWWGKKPRLNAELRIEYLSGKCQTVCTNGHWKAAFGPWLYADIMHGTGYDAQREPAGWKNAGFDATQWLPVDLGSEYRHVPSAHPGVPIVEHLRFAPKRIRKIGDNEAILDFGRCFAGVVSVRVKGARGAKLDFYHAEEMERNGNELHYRGNRSAQAHDCYILSGEGSEHFQPEFTYHGFRYVHVFGLASVEQIQYEGVMISSELPEETLLETRDSTLTKVIWMIRNTEQANLFDMPTDCCARDERLGWGCEGHLFMHTASALNNNARFLRKWLQDILDGQQENGVFWATAPAITMRDILPFVGDTHSDMGYHCAWLLTKFYRDMQPVEKCFPALERSFDYSVRNSDRLLRFNTVRDWLDRNHNGRTDFDHGFGKCDPTLVGTAWFACSARMMADISGALGKSERKRYYLEMYGKIRKAFRTFFLGRNLLLRGSTQGGYMLAAAFDLIEGPELDAARAWVLADMAKSGGITWGTVTTPIALFGMSKLGLDAKSIEFLRSEEYPSIGYMARCGGTAVWERWDGIYEGAFHPHPMNAFSHIGLAGVGDWIVARLAGIQVEEDGFDAVRIAPVFDRRIGGIRGALESVHGTIAVAWQYAEKLRITIDLPVGVVGILRLPFDENIIHIDRGEAGVAESHSADGETGMRLLSGKYEFVVETMNYKEEVG